MPKTIIFHVCTIFNHCSTQFASSFVFCACTKFKYLTQSVGYFDTHSLSQNRVMEYANNLCFSGTHNIPSLFIKVLELLHFSCMHKIQSLQAFKLICERQSVGVLEYDKIFCFSIFNNCSIQSVNSFVFRACPICNYGVSIQCSM